MRLALGEVFVQISHLRFHDSYKLPQKAAAYVDSKGSSLNFGTIWR